MCSIFGMFDLQPGDDLAALRRQALELSRRQRHRGPDWSGVFVDAGVILVHERLAIVDPASGAQPLRSRDGALALAVKDRKSTRLNSSHVEISYAVFCLKKKTNGERVEGG